MKAAHKFLWKFFEDELFLETGLTSYERRNGQDTFWLLDACLRHKHNITPNEAVFTISTKRIYELFVKCFILCFFN